MDDETYVPTKADFKQMPGNAFYVAKFRGRVDNQFSGRRSRPYVARSSISSQNYIKECLEKRLLLNASSIFWPDLAPAHYSNLTMTWYRENNVNIVPKDMNPPNCQELRPIERFWAV